MKLSKSQITYLRGISHKLKPIITISNRGLSAPLMNEFLSTINHHELIKVRVRNHTKDDREPIIEDLCIKTEAQLVSAIGNIALIYKTNNDNQKINLPKN
mgnify:CR=1 FL=1